MFFLCTFKGISISLVEFTSFHSLFALSFHSSVHIPYTCELYQRWAYLKTPLLEQGTFVFLNYFFLLHFMGFFVFYLGVGADLCKEASYKRHIAKDIATLAWWWLGWRCL